MGDLVLVTSSPKRMTDRGGPAGAAAPSFSRLTRVVLRFRWLVLACWTAAAAGGVAAALVLPGHLVNSYAVPGTDSDRATAALARGFGERPEGSFTVVFRTRHSFDPHVQRQLRLRLKRAAAVLPGGRLGTFRAGGGVAYGELQSTLEIGAAKSYTEPLRRALAGPGPAALVSGQPAVAHDLDPQLASDLRRGGAIALIVALVVLAAVLGVSAALAIPFLFAAGTIGASLVLLDAAARIVPLSPYATNIVELLGLGLAIDYSLLIVSRYREELEPGRERGDAIATTIATAGRAVVFSGFAVAIGLALLFLVPVPFVRTLGLAALIVPLVSVAAALTLQPALLSLLGPRALNGGRLGFRAPWASAARRMMRRPLLVLLPSAALLLAAAAPVLGLQLTPGSLSALPRSTESARGLVELQRGFSPGALTPTQVVVDAGSAGAARRPGVHAAVERLADRLVRDPEAYIIALGSSSPYVSQDGRYDRLYVVGRHEFGDPSSRWLVGRLRDQLVPAARFPGGTASRSAAPHRRASTSSRGPTAPSRCSSPSRCCLRSRSWRGPSVRSSCRSRRSCSTC